MTFAHFLADDQFGQGQLFSLIDLAKTIKKHPGDFANALAGKSIAMLFEKPSLRTHVSFDIGIKKLGGHALYLGQQNGKLGERERISDYAKNLSCYADAIVARVYEHSAIKELAAHASVPVINALCNKFHPCQALADFVTLAEHYDTLTGLNFAYVGDGNNVANSLMIMSAILGVNFTLLCPQGHGPNQLMLDKAAALAAQSGASLTVIHQVNELLQQDVLYTDTWLSMGCEATMKDIKSKFMPYQVNHQLMMQTGAKYAMHCQPAHLDYEISTALFDSELALVFEQAENRMWAQNAILVTLLS